MSQKGLAPILIVLLIALAVGGYLIYQNQNKPVISQPVTQSSPTPIASSSAETVDTEQSRSANWKTYTNVKHRYTLKYPANLLISESNDPNGNIDTVTISNYDRKDFSSGRKNPDDSDVLLMFITNPQGNTDLEKAKSYYLPANRLEDYTVGGVSGFKIEQGNIKTIIVVYQRKEYIFNLRPLNSKFANYFNQILSTFKFTQ